MRLLRPSPGECIDRQTILHLKSKYGQLQNLNVKPYTDEITEIQTYLDVHYYHALTDEQGEVVNELYAQLDQANQAIWKMEDEIRLRRDEQPKPVARLAELGETISRMNDDRIGKIKEINAKFHIYEEEKVYLAAVKV